VPDKSSDRVIVIGAGPVGLCLSLALAQRGVTVSLIEALNDDNNAAGETETLRSRYIVSGEGARSIIRKDLGIDFEGFTYSDRTLLIAIFRGEADDDVLDRYERQRRHVAIKHRQADTIRNKRLLAEKDSAVRQTNNDQLRRTSEDPQLARAFLPPSSLIESIREADQIQ
jgi:2-polyprenyl-6-methoxyphenol hydroxylase-like FAD-dependent oxidoreductase